MSEMNKKYVKAIIEKMRAHSRDFSHELACT